MAGEQQGRAESIAVFLSTSRDSVSTSTCALTMRLDSTILDKEPLFLSDGIHECLVGSLHVSQHLSFQSWGQEVSRKEWRVCGWLFFFVCLFCCSFGLNTHHGPTWPDSTILCFTNEAMGLPGQTWLAGWLAFPLDGGCCNNRFRMSQALTVWP